ncbi:MAG: hypothetical protein P0Y62_01745 [Candidatus Chryseobacterium colombiense]|nr:hypothetical protein [Chryseobacterium sp.]WEK70278.1 MAG: hypothetical protein P0Y62_01745 [Chryseobacterium sp.]
MKKQFLTLMFLSFCFWGCNPLYNQYKKLNQGIDKKSRYFAKKKKIIKYILSEENNNNLLLLISWDKSLISNENITFRALIYNYLTDEKKMIYNKKENVQDIVVSKNITDKEFLYILNQYNNGKEDYLLSLHDSFSSSEANFPIYLYDFAKNKKIKIASIAINKEGKIVQ